MTREHNDSNPVYVSIISMEQQTTRPRSRSNARISGYVIACNKMAWNGKHPLESASRSIDKPFIKPHITSNNINTSVGLKQLDNPIDLRRSNGDPPHPEGGVSSPEADGETLK